MRILRWTILAGLLLSACASTQTPEVNLATSVAATLAAQKVGGALPTATAPAAATTVLVTQPGPTPTLGPIPLSGTALPTAIHRDTPAPGPTAIRLAAATPLPTAEVMEIVAVYQTFQNGRMLWLADRGEVWVMVGTTGGAFKVFKDNFRDPDPETDTGLKPPPGYLQPKRGFGRVWRDNADLRAKIGWATDWEYAFTTRATRSIVGAYDAKGAFVPDGELWAVYLGDGSLAYFNVAAGAWGLQPKP